MLGSASRGNSGQFGSECGRSLHTAHFEVAKDGSVKDDDVVPNRVNKNVVALIDNTGGDFGLSQNARLGDVMDSPPTTFEVL